MTKNKNQLEFHHNSILVNEVINTIYPDGVFSGNQSNVTYAKGYEYLKYDWDSPENQKVLLDLTSVGKERPWAEKKEKNEFLSRAYESIDVRKAYRLKDCATYLKYSVFEDGSKKLKEANFCRVRLCPMCAWRKGLKVYSHTMSIMDQMDPEYQYVFLTLTIKNVSGENLSSSIDSMMKGWHKFIQRKSVDNAVKGWYRGLEITHNINKSSNSYDTYHPHFHCVFAVGKHYFTSKDYLSIEKWTSFWEKSMGLDYTPIVDIRKVHGTTAQAVSEVAKYAVKDSDYIIPTNMEMTVDTVRVLDTSLKGRRLVAYGKRFKEIHKELNLDDTENGDLIHIDGDSSENGMKDIVYVWNVGYKQYTCDE